MAKLAALVALAFVFMGCAKMVWWKQDMTRDEFNRDNYACLQQSQQRVHPEVAILYGRDTRTDYITNLELFEECMESRGYSFMRENQLPK